MQSAIQAMAATEKTNHWYRFKSRSDAQPVRVVTGAGTASGAGVGTVFVVGMVGGSAGWFGSRRGGRLLVYPEAAADASIYAGKVTSV
jgi:hypothetical protein